MVKEECSEGPQAGVDPIAPAAPVVSPKLEAETAEEAVLKPKEETKDGSASKAVKSEGADEAVPDVAEPIENPMSVDYSGDEASPVAVKQEPSPSGLEK